MRTCPVGMGSSTPRREPRPGEGGKRWRRMDRGLGAGNLGSALLRYPGFAKEGFEVVAAFDVKASPAREKKLGVKVLPITRLRPFVVENRIKMAILTVPGTVAQEMANELVAAGVLA